MGQQSRPEPTTSSTQVNSLSLCVIDFGHFGCVNSGQTYYPPNHSTRIIPTNELILTLAFLLTIAATTCVPAQNNYLLKVSEDVASQRLRQEATKEEPKGQAMHVSWLLR